MGYAITIIIAIVCAFHWIKWKVATFAMIYYIEKNQYKQPDDKEMTECTDYAAKNLFKDLVRR